MLLMGFSTIATTAALSAARALPDALQAYTFYQQGKTLNRVADKQQLLADQRAAAEQDVAVANQQRAARNASARLASARADAAHSNLMPDGSAHLRETDLATRLQDEITAAANTALDHATRNRQQATLNAWHTRHYAEQSKTSALASGIKSVGSLFSSVASQLNNES